ncbi:hypothetical protein [Anaerofustis stercorihominis]|uniref:Uncharacterized protein n=1 Tax=Anaerofustis stercorihominis TaxID=214853 RepID=A0A3E3E245_9FIRM|nr:hypothetical protein [Anaerofustis stercorihominis]RGD75617.1 hypothetical protein DW687_04640 [Anaerofustis stercorihominis]
MKTKKFLAVLLIGLFIIPLIACGGNKTITSTDFEGEIISMYPKTTESLVDNEVEGLKMGFQFITDGKNLEFYEFDKNSKEYKKIEKEGKLTIKETGEKITKDLTIKNGYAIVISKDYPKYNEIMALFKKLE